MPTPSSNTPPTPPDLPPRTHSSSCPEDAHSPSSWCPDEDGLDGVEMNADSDAATSPAPMAAPAAEIVELLTESRSTTESPRPDSRSGTDRSVSEPIDIDASSHKPPEELGEVQLGATAAPAERHRARCDLDAATVDQDKLDEDDDWIPAKYVEYPPSMGFDWSNIRVCAHIRINADQLKSRHARLKIVALFANHCFQILPLAPSSYLRAGSKFHGTQQSERQVYDVQVEIKHVDLHESFLCGYLRIQGKLFHREPQDPFN